MRTYSDGVVDNSNNMISPGTTVTTVYSGELPSTGYAVSRTAELQSIS